MRLYIAVAIATLLLIGGILMIAFGTHQKKYDCNQPENMCTGYDSNRVVNCLTYPDGCNGCNGCLLYQFDGPEYGPSECKPFDCDSNLLSPGGILMIGFGSLCTFGAVVICILACICCRNQKTEEQINV